MSIALPPTLADPRIIACFLKNHLDEKLQNFFLALVHKNHAYYVGECTLPSLGGGGIVIKILLSV